MRTALEYTSCHALAALLSRGPAQSLEFATLHLNISRLLPGRSDSQKHKAIGCSCGLVSVRPSLRAAAAVNADVEDAGRQACNGRISPAHQGLNSFAMNSKDHFEASFAWTLIPAPGRAVLTYDITCLGAADCHKLRSSCQPASNMIASSSCVHLQAFTLGFKAGFVGELGCAERAWSTWSCEAEGFGLPLGTETVLCDRQTGFIHAAPEGGWVLRLPTRSLWKVS